MICTYVMRFVFLIKVIFWEHHHYLCSHSELILMMNVMKMTLVQMHAPSLEAVNPITLSVLPLPLLLPPSVRTTPFFPSCDPQWGAWTHLHTKRLENNTEQEISLIHLSSQPQWWTSLLSPSVISSRADNEAISICEAYVSQVSRMAQKAFVFGLKRTFITVNTCTCHLLLNWVWWYRRQTQTH